MDFLQLSYFVEVAEQQSFTKAAQKLSISQPALSRQISNLEEELGIRLFARSATGIKITEEGQLALDQVRDLLYHYRTLSDTLSEISSGGSRKLSLGSSVLLNSIIGSNIFISYLYAPDFSIKCYEAPTRALIHMIAQTKLDFGVGIRYDSVVYDHMNEIDLTPFYRGHIYAIARKDALEGITAFAKLPKDQIIVSSLEFQPLLSRSDTAFDSIVFSDTLHAIRAEVLDNDCVGLIPDIALPFFRDEVRCLELDAEDYYECCYISRRGAALTKNFLDFQKLFKEKIESLI